MNPLGWQRIEICETETIVDGEFTEKMFGCRTTLKLSANHVRTGGNTTMRVINQWLASKYFLVGELCIIA
jgi:hypothetical protein